MCCCRLATTVRIYYLCGVTCMILVLLDVCFLYFTPPGKQCAPIKIHCTLTVSNKSSRVCCCNYFGLTNRHALLALDQDQDHRVKSMPQEQKDHMSRTRYSLINLLELHDLLQCAKNNSKYCRIHF